MAIHVNLGDTAAVEAVCEMLKKGVKGSEVNGRMTSIDGKAVWLEGQR